MKRGIGELFTIYSLKTDAALQYILKSFILVELRHRIFYGSVLIPGGAMSRSLGGEFHFWEVGLGTIFSTQNKVYVFL